MKGLEHGLNNLIRGLDSKIRDIKKQEQYLTELKHNFAEAQEKYNRAVADYAARAQGQVELKYLNYASNLNIDINTGVITVNEPTN